MKVGRHFRHGSNKIIVGRDEEENTLLLDLKRKNEHYFEVSECGSPITLLQGPVSKEAIRVAAALTAHYSDSEDDLIIVTYGIRELNKSTNVLRISENEANRLRIT